MRSRQRVERALVKVGKATPVAIRGPLTEGPMAPEISLENQRPAQYVFSEQVQSKLSEIRTAEAQEKRAKIAAKPEANAA